MSVGTRVRPEIFAFLFGLIGLAGLGFALIFMSLSPVTLLGVILGAAIIALLVARPIVSVHLFIAMLYAENMVYTDEGWTGMKAVGGLIVVGWLLSAATRKRLDVRLSALLVIVPLFVGWSAVTMLTAIDSSTALVRVLTYVQLNVVVVMFASVVNSMSRIRDVLRAIVAWTTVVTIHAMALYYLGLTISVSGTTLNRNGLAMYLDVAIVCAYLLQQMNPGGGERIALFCALPILFLGLALTFSRTGYIALVVAFVLLAYRLAKSRGYVLLIASTAMIVAIVLMLPEAFFARVETILPSVQHQEGTMGMRVQAWKAAFRMIREHPIVGVGPDNFVLAQARYARGDMVHLKGLVAHNSFINVAAEMGFVGLVLFVLMNGAAIREAARPAWRGSHAPREMAMAGVAVEMSILMLLITGLMANIEYIKYLYMFFGIASSLGRLALLESGAAALEPGRDGSSPAVLSTPQEVPDAATHPAR
jgi:O-antigen ligase